MAESEEELKSLLMKVKEQSEKAGLILNIQEIGRIQRENSPPGELTPNPLGILGTVHVNKLNFTLFFSSSIPKKTNSTGNSSFRLVPHGNPLQYSCPENPVYRGAWWAAVYGVALSQTRLKRLSSNSSSTSIYLVFFKC